MDIKQVKQKGLSNNSVSEKDLELINQHTLVNLNADDVYTFKVQICDNDVDRVGDKMSRQFLEQVAQNIKGVTGLKDHDWNVENQLARLYDAEVVEDQENKTVLGEPRVYVLGKAYTLSKNKELIDKINAGLLKETSISFNSTGDTCSICGQPMIKNESDIGCCCNNHIAGHMYEVNGENKLCYNDISNLSDILEWSLVAVPCQRKAGINNKKLGGKSIMTRAELLIRQFMSSKSYEKAAPEDKAAIDEAVKTEDSVELTDEDIKKLLDENGKLKAKVKELEDKVKEAEDGRERDKIEAIVSKSIDELHPLTEKVKEMMLKEINWDDLKMEDGQIPGMANVLDGLKESYKGLFKEEEVEDKGCGDVEKSAETEEEAPVNLQTPEVKSEEPKEEIKDEEKVEIKSKGITFGVNSKSVKNTKGIAPGIYFN